MKKLSERKECVEAANKVLVEFSIGTDEVVPEDYEDKDFLAATKQILQAAEGAGK